MILTKEELNWIEENVERHMYTTHYLKYKSATSHQDNMRIADIYDRITTTPCTRNFACAACIFNIWKRVAQVYYNDKSEQGKKEEELKKKRQENIARARLAKESKG